MIITKLCKKIDGTLSASTANGLLVIMLLPFRILINLNVSNIVEIIDQPLYQPQLCWFDTTYDLRV